MPTQTTLSAEQHRKVYSRLSERIDPLRTRHKPLSLLRHEARRLAEQFFNQEQLSLSKAQITALAEEICANTLGVCVLEELFRDKNVQEIMIASPTAVLSRSNDHWLPTSARFSDRSKLRSFLQRMAAIGSERQPSIAFKGSIDVRLPNGFHLQAILPPEALELTPSAVFLRVDATPPSAIIQTTTREIVEPSANDTVSAATTPSSGTIRDEPRTHRIESSTSTITETQVNSPYDKLRQRMTERIVMRFASAGMYDLSVIALPELRRIVLASVHEICNADNLNYDESTRERLALEILAKMNR